MEYIKEHSSNKIQANIKNRVNEFITIDENATRFRYGSKPKDEYLVDLQQMFKIVAELFMVIDSIDDYKNN